jgi:serine/threonine-protein kinase HipA
MSRCLSCFKRLPEEKLCTSCRRMLFGASRADPYLSLSRAEIIKEVRERALRMSLGGAQPKANVKIERGTLQIVGAGGTHLLKPSTEKHPFISENEHFCMNVVRMLRLPTAPFCLVTLRDGELAFLTKRFDREMKRKRHSEDFASVLGLPSDSKYTSSYLDVLKASDQHCRDKGIERIRIFTLILASYVLGNNDLHLKNFSLIDQDSYYALSPVYDVVCAKVYYPHTEDLALDIKSDYLGSLEQEGFYTKRDFLYLAKESGIHEKQALKVINEILEKRSEIESLLAISFLPQEMKNSVGKIIHEQFRKLGQGYIKF